MSDTFFALRPSQGAMVLVLRHDGWRQFPRNQGAELERQHEQGWARHLAQLKAYAETADAVGG